MTAASSFEFQSALASVEAAEALGRALAAGLRPGDLLLLSGDLGAGKTLISGAICHALGLAEEEPVCSPTYALVSEYATQPKVLHADLYRLHQAEEVYELGLLEARDQGAVLLIEWGKPFAELLGGGELELELSVFPRVARLRARNERSRELVSLLKKSFQETESEEQPVFLEDFEGSEV